MSLSKTQAIPVSSTKPPTLATLRKVGLEGLMLLLIVVGTHADYSSGIKIILLGADSTAGNGVRVTFCNNGNWEDGEFSGLTGEWKPYVYWPSYVLKGIQVKYEDPFQGDNTALTGLKGYFCLPGSTNESTR